MVAVGSGKASPLGEVYNEVPDRIADPLILIGAGFAAGGSPTLGYVAALLAVFVAYVRVLGRRGRGQRPLHRSDGQAAANGDADGGVPVQRVRALELAGRDRERGARGERGGAGSRVSVRRNERRACPDCDRGGSDRGAAPVENRRAASRKSMMSPAAALASEIFLAVRQARRRTARREPASCCSS